MRSSVCPLAVLRAFATISGSASSCCSRHSLPSMRCSGLGRPHTRARSDHPVLGARFCQDPGRWPLKRIRELGSRTYPPI